MQDKAVIICGPTASGKSSFAIDYAVKNNGEIINIDSLQVYKEIKVLTASPDDEDLKKVQHHLFNFVSGGTHFTVAKYLDLARKTAQEIISKGKLPVFVGGTGFYIKAVLEGINESQDISDEVKKKVKLLSHDEMVKILKENTSDIFDKINENDKYRITKAMEYFLAFSTSYKKGLENKKSGKLLFDFEIIYLKKNKSELHQNIEKRIQNLPLKDLIDETKILLNAGFEGTIAKALWAIQIKKYLNGDIDLQQAKELMQIKDKQYAKRQYTFFNNQLKDYDVTIID